MCAARPATTVLIVDDKQALADLYGKWLNDEYAVRTAYSGSEALDRVDDVDVVLLDRRMPDRRGREVLDTIRERGLDCPVAMVTAVKPDIDVVDMPFDDYLTKPVDPDDLRNAVERLLNRARYDTKTRRCFELASKRATLEASLSESELAESDRYESLVKEHEAIRAEIDAVAASFDGSDRKMLFQPIGNESAESEEIEATVG